MSNVKKLLNYLIAKAQHILPNAEFYVVLSKCGEKVIFHFLISIIGMFCLVYRCIFYNI